MKEKNAKVRKIVKDGILNLSGFKLYCCVLDDGTRGFSGREMQEAFNMVDEGDKWSSGGRLVRHLEQKSLQPFIHKEKKSVHFNPIVCYKGRTKFHIYDANLMPLLCFVYLELERETIKKGKKLPIRQEKIVDRSIKLLGGFAETGITALIDEATGYQYERDRDALQKKWQTVLGLYTLDEPQEWEKIFPQTYYGQISRVWNWKPPSPKSVKRPSFVGKLTNDLIYDNLPDGVLEKLKKETPKTKAGNRKHRFHQLLTTEVGREDLRKTISAIETLLSISGNKEEFKKLEEKYRFQKKLLYNSLIEDDESEKEQIKEDFDRKFKALLKVPTPKKNK